MLKFEPTSPIMQSTVSFTSSFIAAAEKQHQQTELLFRYCQKSTIYIDFTSKLCCNIRIATELYFFAYIIIAIRH